MDGLASDWVATFEIKIDPMLPGILHKVVLVAAAGFGLEGSLLTVAIVAAVDGDRNGGLHDVGLFGGRQRRRMRTTM